MNLEGEDQAPKCLKNNKTQTPKSPNLFMQTRYLLWAFLLFPWIAQAQNIQVSGTIKDAANGETLIGASIIQEGTTNGTVTNEYGFYSLSMPVGRDSVTLRYSYIGYQALEVTMIPDVTRTIPIQLSDGGNQLEAVEVVANSFEERLRSTEMSVTGITVKEAKLLPALFGEVDLLKTLQLRPGINAGSEGNSALFVRGGGGDQNLIVLDEAVVYNANHLFGFFSTFNPDAVKDVKLFKGGFPAQYGGRLSSVIDVKLKDGNNKKLSASGGIGLIASRGTIEGPFAKGKGSFIVSARRTYADLITKQVNKANADKVDWNPIPDYYFYDLNTKVNYQIGDKDRIYASGYFGRDVFAFSGGFFNFNFDWGNATGTVRWNHTYNSRLFSNTTATYSDYRYNISNRIAGFSFNLGSRIEDINFKQDFYYSINQKHKMRFGAQVTHHRFEVGRLRAGSDDGSISFNAGDDFTGYEFAVYANDEYQISKRLKGDFGLRVSGWWQDTNRVFYAGLEPRASLNYSLTPKVAVKASYARMFQYVHLVSNSSISLPTDVWYPSTKGVKPERSDQVALGYSWLVSKKYFLTQEVYYKWMKNQIDFVDHAELFANPNLETQFAFGDGFATGMEIELEKKEGKLTGWIGYTLSLVRRGNFSNIMEGRYYGPRNDRRHNATVVAIYKFSPRWSATATWVYGSGDLSWIASGRLTFQDVEGTQLQPVVPVYGDRNAVRLPAYHRMDLGVVYNLKPKWGDSDLTLSIYNAYDRRNPYIVFLEPELSTVDLGGGQSIDLPTRIAAKQVSLFPVLPTITWNFSF
jgi:TonB dependent receptor/CarboxypepD_reg-like domain/TonB-dependent Receptor Plug Domain